MNETDLSILQKIVEEILNVPEIYQDQSILPLESRMTIKLSMLQLISFINDNKIKNEKKIIMSEGEDEREIDRPDKGQVMLQQG